MSTGVVRLSLETGTSVAAQVCVAGGGARPKCLLLHGNPGSLADFRWLVPLLSSALDLVAIDLPGFGQSARSDPKPEALALERLAEHAMAVADVLAWKEPYFLIGHSHGGGVAQVAAAQYPDRVAGLVLLATLGAPAHSSYRLLSAPGAETLARVAGALLRARRLPALSRWVVGRVMRDIFLPEPVPRDRLESELSSFAERPEILISMVHVALGKPCAKLLETAPDIRCPTLFLHGAADALVPVACARSIHERIASAGGSSRFEVVPGAGHMLLQYQVSEVAAQVLAHVSRQRAS